MNVEKKSHAEILCGVAHVTQHLMGYETGTILVT